MRKEDQEFKASPDYFSEFQTSLDYRMRLSQKQTKENIMYKGMHASVSTYSMSITQGSVHMRNVITP